MNNLIELYRVEQLPVFQNRMYPNEEAAIHCPRGDMRLVQNLDTGLIYNADFTADLMVYDAEYQNEQAVSQQFRQHLSQVLSIIDRNLGRQALVEVGCGKGFFLEFGYESGFDITGFDPTYEGNNPRIQKHYFEAGITVTAHGLILRHVLEHIENPVAFLDSLRAANNGEGLIYIEVPCFDWIIKHRAWFDVFYEHVNYFRLQDFQRMFGVVVESGRLFGGQYIYVVADLASLRQPDMHPGVLVDFPIDFIESVTKPNQIRSDNAAIWGGASKGVIFALLRARAGYPVKTVIDINPAKQGKYLPATGLRVQPPKIAETELPDGATIYVMNSNYLDEIRAMTNNKFNYIGIDHE